MIEEDRACLQVRVSRFISRRGSRQEGREGVVDDPPFDATLHDPIRSQQGAIWDQTTLGGPPKATGTSNLGLPTSSRAIWANFHPSPSGMVDGEMPLLGWRYGLFRIRIACVCLRVIPGSVYRTSIRCGGQL